MWKQKKITTQVIKDTSIAKRLYDIFLPFWDFLIIKITYDPIEGIVCIVLKHPEKDISYELLFKQVSFYLFIQNSKNVFNYDDFREMSSITFEKENINTKSIQQEWLNVFSFDFNIVIDIIYSILVIKAETVIFDGREYKLQD